MVFCFSALVQQVAAFLTMGPTPDMAVTTETGSFLDGTVSWITCSMRGWRDDMEDAHVVEMLPHDLFPDTALFAVLDGHGGKEVSKLTSSLLTAEVAACGLQLKDKARAGSKSLQDALERALPRIDSKLRAGFAGIGKTVPLQFHPFAGVGSTACVAAVDFRRREITVANVGDSRALLIRDGKAVALSTDHKPEDQIERNRIRAAGGEVRRVGPCWRVDGNLNLSRALGDFRLKANSALPPERQKVIAVPDSTRTSFKGGPQELLVVACDGLFESFSNQDVADFVWPRFKDKKPLEQIGKELLHACCARNYHGRPQGDGTDNETVILVKLPGPSKATTGATAPTVADGGAAGGGFKSGQAVRICGLESEAGQRLNSQEGVVQGPSKSEGRLEVLVKGEIKLLKASNLKAVKETPGVDPAAL